MSGPTLAYHDHARVEIFGLLPGECGRVLEIGAGTGATVAALKRARDVRFSAGVEIAEGAAVRARASIDEVVVGDIEHLDLPAHWKDFGVILCLDVLEHLVDPWAVVRRLHQLLAPGGVIIASLPNVSHISVVLPLLFRGRWELRDAGILDRTHLRFFVRRSAIELMTCSGLALQAIESGGLPRRSKRWWANNMSLGLFERFLAPQYYLRVGPSVTREA